MQKAFFFRKKNAGSHLETAFSNETNKNQEQTKKKNSKETLSVIIAFIRSAQINCTCRCKIENTLC